MKKILSILVLSLLVSIFGISQAQAITVDGFVSPGEEWDTYWIRGTDPNEAGIDDDYDIEILYAWWDDTDVYIRTDVFGSPTLDNIDPSLVLTKTMYQWTIDTDGDEVGDIAAVLLKANYDAVEDNYAVDLYRLDTTAYLGSGIAELGDIVEVTFETSLVPTDLEPESDYDVAMYLALENAGGDEDDRLPNAGWVHTIPEPTSMLLLGIGLIGLAGSKVRKRFRA